MRLIMKHNLANKKPKVMKYIINKLMKYNWRTFPHRCLLILDDFANHALLRSKETDLSRLLKKLRHFHINVMICVQTVKLALLQWHLVRVPMQFISPASGTRMKILTGCLWKDTLIRKQDEVRLRII